MQLIDEKKERTILVGLTAVIAFVGLEIVQEIMRVYEIKAFLWTALVVYVALFFLQAFVFDLHIKRSTTFKTAARNFVHAFQRRFRYMLQLKHLLHFQSYQILPATIYWSTIALIFINPFNQTLKQVWVVLSSLALVLTFWYLKTIFYNHRGASYIVRQQTFIIKLYATFLAYTASLGVFHYFGFEAGLFGVTVFCITFILVYQALFQHHNVSFETLKYILFLSTLLGLVGVAVYVFWNVNYFSGALVMAAVYNTAWGLLHHKFMDNDLTKSVLYEYLAVLFFVLVVLFSITNFSERI